MQLIMAELILAASVSGSWRCADDDSLLHWHHLLLNIICITCAFPAMMRQNVGWEKDL